MSLYTLSIIPLLFLSSVLPSASHYLKCREPFYRLTTQNNITHCKRLTTLEAEFGWQLDDKNKSLVRIVFGTRKHEGVVWIAWGVNPSKRSQMVGTRAMLGLRHQDGKDNVTTYNITSDTKRGCKLVPSNVEVEFQDMKFEYLDEINYLLLWATVGLPDNCSITKLNMVWQVGHDADGDVPKKHSSTLQNFDSIETIDLKTGKKVHHVGWQRNYLRVMHGVFNIAGWGTLLPAGVVVARYAKYPLEWKLEWLPEQWLTIHKAFQITGFTIGTAGWGIGLWLGHASRDYTFYTHRRFAIFIFSFAALQMLALHFKPAKDGALRGYWNMYHHFVGYALLVVIGINIFIGISNLKPENAAWRWSYVGIIGAFALFFICLEVYAWKKFINTSRRNKEKETIQGEGKIDQDNKGVDEGKVAQSTGSTSSSSHPRGKVSRSAGSISYSSQPRGEVARSTGTTSSSSQPRASTSISINPI